MSCGENREGFRWPWLWYRTCTGCHGKVKTRARMMLKSAVAFPAHVFCLQEVSLFTADGSHKNEFG